MLRCLAFEEGFCSSVSLMNSPLLRMILLMWISASTARAAIVTWDGGGVGDNWSLDNNWNPNAQPPSDGTADLVFAGTTRLTPNANLLWSIRSIAFASGAGAFSIIGQTLTIGSGGITQSDNNTQAISNNIVLSGPQTW